MFIDPNRKPYTALEILAECVNGSLGDMLALHGHDEASLTRLVRLGFINFEIEKRGRGRTWWHVKRYYITAAGRAHHAKQTKRT
jgi:hypothetical protein